MSAYKLWSFIILGVFILAILAKEYFEIPLSEQVLSRIFLYGTFASVAGLIVVFVQILGLRSISKASEESAGKTKRDIFQFLYALDVSRNVKDVQAIQGYNRMKQWSLSIMKMQELKQALIQIIVSPQFSELISLDHYKDHVSVLSINISSLEKEAEQKKNSIKVTRLNDDLERIFDDLMDLETRLKQSGGTNG